jgi:hypothetical protein
LAFASDGSLFVSSYLSNSVLRSQLGSDFYKVDIDSLSSGESITFSTSTPGDGQGQPVNRLVPKISLFDSQKNTISDVIVSAGTYYVGVSGANSTTGEYVLKLNKGSALTASSLPGYSSSEVITRSGVQPLFAEALSRWQSTGVDPSRFGSIEIRVADLGGTTLGRAAGRTIWLDDNAAGWGWFVDRTPGSDSEFLRGGNQGEQDHMDLLTVVMHEVGHLLGHDHEEDSVMTESLAAGVRRTNVKPGNTALPDQIFAYPIDYRADAWLGGWLSDQLESHRPWGKRRR